MSFQDKLRYYRERSGISGKEFAAQLGIKYGTYNSYESAGKEPKYDVLCRIASALNVSIDELMDFTPDRAQYWVSRFPSTLLSVQLVDDKVVIRAEGTDKKAEVTLTKEDFVNEMERIAQEIDEQTAENRQKMFELSAEHHFLERFVYDYIYDLL